MAYDPKVVQAARERLEQRREDAIARATAAQNEWCAKVPRLDQIRQELAQTVPELTRAILDNDPAGVEEIRSRSLALQQERAQLLHKAGFSRPDFQPDYTCSRCEDTGFVDGQVCDCYRRLLQEEAGRQLSGVSPMKLTDFASFDLSYYSDVPEENLGCSPRQRMRDLLEFCRAYAEAVAPGAESLLLQGPTGVGKTHLSLAIARRATERGLNVIYGSVRTFLRRMEAEHFGRAEGDTESQLIECDLLVLDDLGMETDTPFYRSALYAVINDRVLEDRPTVISTNMGFVALRDRYGDQIVSRITGGFQPLFCAGKDIRQMIRRQDWQ